MSSGPVDAKRLPSVLVLTGAGVSADSGVATFRDAGGLWEGLRPEEVATPEAWARDASMVWRFYQARRRALVGVEPNPAHRALARLERAVSARRPDLLRAFDVGHRVDAAERGAVRDLFGEGGVDA